MAPGSPRADAAVRAAEVARTGYGRLVALLAAADGDIAAAEDALGDALERALRRWPEDGIPDRPEAWLLTVARNRQRDRWRSASHRTSVELEPDRHSPALLEDVDPDALPDHRLALMAACAHPAIDPGVRTPLMLGVVLGCTAEQIGRAMSVPTTTMASRLVRAKRRIRERGIPVEVPGSDVLPERMAAIREAVHGVHAIEWASSDPEPVSDLVGEALHLSELLTRLAPHDAEAHGLAALVALSASRLPARGGRDGFVPLAEQDPRLWDPDLIARGEEHLRAGHALGELGRFQVEAAIQAVHCARRRTGRTDWSALRRLHEMLLALAPTRGARVSHAVVTAEGVGPQAGLDLLDALEPVRPAFQPEWAARGHLLALLGRADEARTAWQRAISLTTAPAQRRHLEEQVAALADPGRRGALPSPD
ncbi:RNA polymerase sigma-70 factor, ECF subfamily [Janibacter indicus]|uniref:RNA polymerase sigma-70 factor, ECF subfamily n=1 Tax=Janibacter indicus TaxID=857417 RepID=A0A1W1ZBM1_9MICO|nr:DUF6596 domain-containing protein [Janibacter sp. YB324]QNF94889.1 RNA polymerase subunit sigma-70 [Janibacter sp. YB324]SMC45810.1 RNA polymerase sigma-70 factor, ECF subfamily [Janibacter indicus]